jgi:hypothetical protein
VLFNHDGYDAACLSAGEITMTNDLFWGNGDDVNFRNLGGDPVTDQQLISYCDIEDGDLNGTNQNVSVNPDFIGQIASGTFSSLAYDNMRCRSTITHNGAGFTPDALARRFLWVSDTAFYIEANTADQIVVYGDVTQVASVGFNYRVMDYHLHPLSLCVDAGTGAGALDHDFEGDPRPSNGGNALRVDMGADEYVEPPPTRSRNWQLLP